MQQRSAMMGVRRECVHELGGILSHLLFGGDGWRLWRRVLACMNAAGAQVASIG